MFSSLDVTPFESRTMPGPGFSVYKLSAQDFKHGGTILEAFSDCTKSVGNDLLLDVTDAPLSMPCDRAVFLASCKLYI